MKALHIPVLALSALLASAPLLLPLAGHAEPVPAPAGGQATPAPAPTTGTDAAPVSQAASDPMRRRRNDEAAFLDARLAALHAGLQLTPEQDHLWGPLEAAMRDLAPSSARRHPPDGDPKATGLDELRRRSDWMVRRGEAIRKLADAGAPFAAGLTDDQKARLPALLEQIRPRTIIDKVFGIEGAGQGSDGGQSVMGRFADHPGLRGRPFDDEGVRRGHDGPERPDGRGWRERGGHDRGRLEDGPVRLGRDDGCGRRDAPDRGERDRHGFEGDEGGSGAFRGRSYRSREDHDPS